MSGTGDLITNRPSSCSVAVGRCALRASDLCKSSARASFRSWKHRLTGCRTVRFRCKECVRPGQADDRPMRFSGQRERRGSASAKSWLRVNEIALVATQMEVAAKCRVQIGHSFDQSPMRYCECWRTDLSPTLKWPFKWSPMGWPRFGEPGTQAVTTIGLYSAKVFFGLARRGSQFYRDGACSASLE